MLMVLVLWEGHNNSAIVLNRPAFGGALFTNTAAVSLDQVDSLKPFAVAVAILFPHCRLSNLPSFQVDVCCLTFKRNVEKQFALHTEPPIPHQHSFCLNFRSW